MKIKLVKQSHPISFKNYLIFNNYKIKILNHLLMYFGIIMTKVILIKS